MPTRITILGAGPGGYIAAIRAAQLGAQVTIIENDEVGGTCLNWGCIPTKTLKATADALKTARRLSDFGLELEGQVRPNPQAIMARKNKVVSDLVTGIRRSFKHYKINLMEGRGIVIDPKKVRVELKDGPVTEIEGDRLILATGSQPMNIPAFPFDGQTIISSNEALLLEQIPEELIIIGGGVVGCEFAFIFSELGSKVTIVEGLDRLVGLPSVDHDLSKTLQRELKKKKIKLYLNKTVTKTEPLPDGSLKACLGPSPFLKQVTEKDRQVIELTGTTLLVSIGREFNTKDLGLEQIGLSIHPKGWLPANLKMETNLPGVYAIGDILGPEKIMLAHVASSEALVAVENCLGNNKEMNYDATPAGIFTSPEIATVGLTETQAAENGLDYRADTTLFRDLGKAQAMSEVDGQFKMISDNKTGRILGVHIIGPHATDLIAEATLAMRLGATVKDIASTIHVHPSLPEVMLETAQAALGSRFHTPPKK